MPHFVVDCSQSILQYQSEEKIIEHVHRAASSTDLFDEDQSQGQPFHALVRRQ